MQSKRFQSRTSLFSRSVDTPARGMPLESATQIGATYVWGFQAADAPNIGPGFVPRRAEIKYEPEVKGMATDGEGHVDSVTVSKADKRKWTTTFSGYITDE